MIQMLQNYRCVATENGGASWVDSDGSEVMRLFNFEGPNLMRLEACGVIVMMASCPLNMRLSASQRNQFDQLLVAVGFANRPLESLTDHLGDWLLQLLQQLQRHLFFPVQWSQLVHRADGAVELGFELGRAAWSGRLVDHALSLVQIAFHGPTVPAIQQVMDQLGNTLSQRLSYLYRQDRHKTATRLGIFRPTSILLDMAWSYFGQGKDACLIAGGSTSQTSAMGKELAGDKSLAWTRLRLNGLPVLRQRIVDSSDEAVSAAQQLGYPVVVKPLRGHQSKGVSVNLKDDEAVRAACTRAKSRHALVLVEPYLRGLDYRLLVIDGKLVAAAQRDARTLKGDGYSTVAELIEAANRSTRGTGLFFSAITLDEGALATLAAQGHTPAAILAAGETLRMREMASPESTATDVTDTVHPDNRAMAVDAARSCMLNVAGIDFVSPDISVSWRTNGARIIEVNSGPAADLHLFPQYGAARDISWHLIRSCLPAASPGRIPVVMCFGNNHPAGFLEGIANTMTQAGYRVGRLANEEDASQSSLAVGVAAMLTNPEFNAAAFGWPLTLVPSDGFPVDRVRVSVITHLQPDLVDTAHRCWGEDQVLRMCRLACDLATDAVVIDGTSPLLRAAVAHRPAGQIGYLWWASSGTDDTPLRQHLLAGGWAITPDMISVSDDREGDKQHAAMGALAVMRVLPALRQGQDTSTDAGSPRHAAIEVTVPWTPQALAHLFCGSWVNGPDSGWQVSRAVTQLSKLEPGDLFVCDSRPDDLTRLAANEAEILRAFVLGARAVVATQVPSELARWQPVLVCDDPAAGFRRLEAG